MIKVTGTSNGRKSLDDDVSQVPLNVHPRGCCQTEVGKNLEQQKLEGKLFFFQKQLENIPQFVG